MLRQVGGWDPHNVTEDADLGMRLFRLGYRVGVLRCQTLEDAPVAAAVWMRQRTRWFKGWLQTWLVVMRDGRSARREMGTWAFLVFHLLIGGMLLSALLHPAMLVFVGVAVTAMLDMPRQSHDVLRTVLLAIDMINVFGAYACFVALGGTAMIAHEKRLIGYRWLGIPVYWLMMTVAAWNALYELKTRPFFWHKTPHVPVVAKDASASMQPGAPAASNLADETQ